ncbi:hypothetical protein GH714_018927 [Hevea brasiliensis]|uniref:Reverse transcriptase Ty1/copia-type domain-containing protein n=1 Tax=Hevea brasiliensis TaxID=3981 RepID=A0A6A6LHU7_HEVBR|nr:hypothetical protein GH714_018927 [Hevea brasiliensis]
MTSEGSFIQPAIPRFDGHYDHWSMLMENFLRSKEFWELVESGYIEPSSASAQTEAQRKKTEEMKLKDLKVKNYLFQAIDRTVLDTILKKDTAKDIWDAMKKKFEGNAKVKRSHLQALRREFETLEMRSSEGVTEYFSRVMTVANKMRLYGEDMQDVKVVEKILRSLTEKFNYVVCSIEESKDIDALTVDELQSSLIVHEQKFQRRNGEEQVLKVTSEGGRGRGRGTFRGETCDERDGSSEGEDRVRELQQSRERQPPMWMGDYVSGEGLSDDEVHMKYALEVLRRFSMMESNSVGSPIVPGFKISREENDDFVDETYYKQLVGSLMYLTTTRPDMMFVTCLISRYMTKPTKIHLQAAKRALRYLKGTVNYGIHYKKGGDGELLAFTDSDYAGDMEDRKSTSGYVFLMNSSAVSWCSKKQPIVTLSTTEAEFVAAAVCACQGVWIKRILKELGQFDGGCTTVMCDNSSTIKLSKNPVMHGRSKHIDVRFHFLRNLTKEGVIELVHCGSQDQVADIMTKPLKLDVFQKLRKLLGKFNPSRMGMTVTLVKEALGAHNFLQDNDEKVQSAPAQVQQRFLGVPDKDIQFSATGAVKGHKVLKQVDSTGDSDDNVVSVPHPKVELEGNIIELGLSLRL